MLGQTRILDEESEREVHERSLRFGDLECSTLYRLLRDHRTVLDKMMLKYSEMKDTKGTLACVRS